MTTKQLDLLFPLNDRHIHRLEAEKQELGFV